MSYIYDCVASVAFIPQREFPNRDDSCMRRTCCLVSQIKNYSLHILIPNSLTNIYPYLYPLVDPFCLTHRSTAQIT